MEYKADLFFYFLYFFLDLFNFRPFLQFARVASFMTIRDTADAYTDCHITHLQVIQEIILN